MIFMDTNQLSISFSNDSASTTEDAWLNLEQDDVSDFEFIADYSDIYQMFIRAKSGLSATSYLNSDCPLTVNEDGDIVITIDFYVFPSSLDLAYSLSINSGEISAGEEVSILKEGNLVVKKSKTAQLPFLADIESVSYGTPVFNTSGEIISTPDINFSGSTFTFDTAIFTVLRLKCQAIGYKHTATLTFEKTLETVEALTNVVESQSTSSLFSGGSFSLNSASGYDSNMPEFEESLEDFSEEETTTTATTTTATNSDPDIVFNKINNVNITAKATYIDENGDEQENSIELLIAPCVLSMLEYCPDSEDFAKLSTATYDPGGIPTIYYSTCTGNILALNYE